MRNGDWFHSVPRRFFRYPTWSFPVYLLIGYGLTGSLHFRIWLDSAQVESFFSNLGFSAPRPTPANALLLFTATGIGAAWVFHRLLARLTREGGVIELVFWGTVVSGTAAWIPWLYASSVVNTIFLFLFGMVALAGFALAPRFLQGVSIREERHFDPWKMFVNATKVCAAVVALLVGAVATSILLPWRATEIEGPGLFRYAVLSSYVVLGMLAFVLMPLLVRALETGPTDDAEFDIPGPV